MISLHEYTGLVDVDEENLKVTVKAGTSLRNLSLLLQEEGLAMINLGSVAGQSLGGAISTGRQMPIGIHLDRVSSTGGCGGGKLPPPPNPPTSPPKSFDN